MVLAGAESHSSIWLNAARHLPILQSLLKQSGTAGNLTSDAHLAALATEYGASVVSFDGDFHRFPSAQLEYLAAGLAPR